MAHRLESATSPYLRSAARQPVEWYPWCEEAFARARAEDKPILLDIGAVWCHWCHVMDRESYENPEIASIINAHFVAIKVDRDERPDVDVRYQRAVSAITGQGGWPLTAFLTPEGQVFFGGTYFPPDAAMGRPGFRQVLVAVAEFYRSKRAEAYAYADKLVQALRRLGEARSSEDELSPSLLSEAVGQILRQFDVQHGGFDGPPKFPHPTALELLLRYYDRTGEPQALLAVTRTLEKMGRGGVYDQIGGGFHRYAVDASWTVPHFEKMLYDNAGLLRAYVCAYQATGRAFFKEIAEGILAYVTTTWLDPAGGFYASQDADISPDDDGGYYTWTLGEAASVLPEEELAVIRLAYHLDGPGEMAHDPRRHVLFLDKDPDAVAVLLERPLHEVQELLARGRRRLLEARTARPAPFVDRTVYTGWNGLMISACFQAARWLPARSAYDIALCALDRILREAYAPGSGFRHIVGETSDAPSLLDDQVHMAAALLDAFEATGDLRYLATARETMDYAIAAFSAPSGALYDVPPDDLSSHPRGAQVPYIPLQDAPTPSGNGTAALVLDRLAVLTGEPRYREAADRLLRACAPGRTTDALYTATLYLALEYHLSPPVRVVVVGAREDPRTRALHEGALSVYRPGAVVHLYDPSEAGPVSLPGEGMPTGGAPSAYVCTATSCATPCTDPELLKGILREFGRVPVA